jgi:thiol-disulfide isomerase/thioredoxin
MTRLPALLLTLCLAACGTGSDSGDLLALDRPDGDWRVVNYWAEWCKPCIREIPELNALDKQYDDVRVLGVNYDDAKGRELAEQVERLGIEFPTLPRDPAADLGVQRPQVLPTTVIVDPAGRVTAVLVGPQTLASLADALGRAAPAEAEAPQP